MNSVFLSQMLYKHYLINQVCLDRQNKQSCGAACLERAENVVCRAESLTGGVTWHWDGPGSSRRSAVSIKAPDEKFLVANSPLT